jgi:hypothetical protein
MINNRRKTREMNRLSAYIDNALSARQKQKLEVRLARDPELREKLDNLRRTKLAMSHLARLPAPRNFTLTPDMVPERRPHRHPVQFGLRLASALAAILLVVTFGADFIFSEVRPSQELAADAIVMMEAAQAPTDSTPEPLIQWGPPEARGEVNGMGGDALAMEEPMLEIDSVPAEEIAPESEILPAKPSEIQEQAVGEAPDPNNSAGAKSQELILGINKDQAGEIINRSEPASTQPEPAPLSWAEILRWAQISLAVIAVGCGLAVLILRRRGHS